MIEASFYGRALARGWWIVVVVALLAAAVAWIASTRQSPVYKASATLVATPSSRVEETDELIDAVETLERRSVVATFAKVPPALETRRRAARRMDVELDDLRYYWIGATVLPNTNVIRIDVLGSDPDTAAEVANAVAAATRREGRSLYKIFTLRHLDEATPPRRPERPAPRRSALVGLALGVFFGLLTAFGLEALRRRA